MNRERRLSPWRLYRQAEPVWSLLFVGMTVVAWLFALQDVAAWQGPIADVTIAVLLSVLIWLQMELACTREELRLSKIREEAAWHARISRVEFRGIISSSPESVVESIRRAQRERRG